MHYDASDDEAFENLAPDRRSALAAEMLRLQESYERDILPLVSEELRERYLERAPTIIHFQPGRTMSVSTRRSYF